MNHEDDALKKNIKADSRFDLERLRLSQDYESQAGVRKALITVPVRKPNRQAFIRVHPDPTYRIETAVLELSEDKTIYLVSRELWSQMAAEISPRILFTAIDRQQNVFIWPAKLPGTGGRHNEWNSSALEAAQRAMKKWIRVVSNQDIGAYEIYEAQIKIPDPEWPDCSFQQLLEIAFRDRFIDTPDHPIIRRLREGA